MSGASRRPSSWRTPSSTASCCRPTRDRATASCSPSPPRAARACSAACRPSADALAKAAREALRIAHFDPDTGDDLGGVTGDDGHVTQPCGKGCYNCLLSYGNQPYHEQLDRHRARDLLLAIAGGATLTTGRGESRTEQTIRLIGQADSTLEEEFLQWLKDHGHRLPDAAQVTVPEAYARPDFTYRLPGGPVAVFVDGPVHDGTAAAERDASAAERLEDLGWYVIRFRYDDDWPSIVAANRSVFGEGR